MSMTSEDKKDMILIVNGAIEALILPRFDVIENRLDKVEENITILKDDLTDLQLTANRIEITQKSELNRVDDHELRICKLEKVRR